MWETRVDWESRICGDGVKDGMIETYERRYEQLHGVRRISKREQSHPKRNRGKKMERDTASVDYTLRRFELQLIYHGECLSLEYTKRREKSFSSQV